jgi:hypothetical protein
MLSIFNLGTKKSSEAANPKDKQDEAMLNLVHVMEAQVNLNSVVLEYEF